jgi:hypothetical protein
MDLTSGNASGSASSSALRAAESGAYSGLAAVGGLQANLLIGVGSVFGLLLIYAGVAAKNRAPGPPPFGGAPPGGANSVAVGGAGPGSGSGSVAWGLVAAGVAVGAGAVAAGRWMKRSKRREALVGAAGLMRLL